MTLLYRVFASFEFISRSQNEVKWQASSLMGIYLNPYSSLKCVQLDKSCHSHALICFPRFDWLVVSDMLVIVVTMIDPFAHQMSKHGCMGRIEQEKSFQIRLEYIPDPNPGSRAHREDREGPAHGCKSIYFGSLLNFFVLNLWLTGSKYGTLALCFGENIGITCHPRATMVECIVLCMGY